MKLVTCGICCLTKRWLIPNCRVITDTYYTIITVLLSLIVLGRIQTSVFIVECIIRDYQSCLPHSPYHLNILSPYYYQATELGKDIQYGLKLISYYTYISILNVDDTNNIFTYKRNNIIRKIVREHTKLFLLGICSVK